MKKLIFTLLGLLLLLIGSCVKEEIRPLKQSEHIETEPEYSGRKLITDDPGNKNKCADPSEFGNSKVIPDSLRNITDPNRDEDEDRRIKNRK